MKNLIKSTLLLLLSLQFSLSYSQTEGISLGAGNSTSNLYVPFEPPSNPEVQFRSLDFEFGFSSNMVFLETEAWNNAGAIWADFLDSDVPIKVNVQKVSMDGDDVLGTSSGDGVGPFSTNYPTQLEFPNIYVEALADKLAGVDLDPGGNDIWIRINDNIDNFYFGNPDGIDDLQYDYLSTCLHLLGNGLGFHTWAEPQDDPDADQETARFGFGSSSSFIYSNFIENTDGISLLDFPTGVYDSDLYDFFTSNSLIWNGPNAFGAKIHAANPFVEINSSYAKNVNHLDELTYNNTPDALMTPTLDLGEVIHSPGEIAQGILKDIGWDNTIITGFNDHVSILGFDVNCFYTSGWCGTDIWQDLFISPETTLDLNQTYVYMYHVVDNEPFNNFFLDNWKIHVLHSEGRYELATCSYPDSECTQNGPSYFEFQVPELPSGYQWTRNALGKVRAEVTITTNDNQGYINEGFLEIGINSGPDLPRVEFLQNVDCTSATIEFFARGATSYKVHEKPVSSNSWNVHEIPSGEYTYTDYGSLTQSRNYEFMVEAINSGGSTFSEIITRHICADKTTGTTVTVFPNPTFMKVTAKDDDNNALDNVRITKLDDSSTERFKNGNGTNKVDVNIYDLPPGTYNVRIEKQNGNIVNKQIVIF